MTDHLVRCPNGHLGRIDDEQLAGDVSIVCEAGGYTGDDECDFHGYVGDVEIVERDYTPRDDRAPRRRRNRGTDE